ncbi:MAG: ABC transporter permease [Deltaproteobacteria bacterium]|nr:ABC transporter permease [Deltaproteobacteria bacterium]
MRKIWAVAMKEFRQARRDRLTLAMLLGLPTFMLLLYGYALNFDVMHAKLAIEDDDKSAVSRSFAETFVASGYFDRADDLSPGTDLVALTQRREAEAILIIPESFSEDLSAGRDAQAQLILDGANANTATTLLGYASSIAAAANVELATARVGGSMRPDESAIRVEPRVWYNPELKSTQFLVPGLIGFILMLTAVISTALSVVREKERGTLEQLRVTSLSSGQLIVGKLLPYLVISLVATTLILVAARVLFHVQVRGPYLDLYAATLLYLIGALGWGLLVSTLVDNQAMAFQISTLTSMMPAIFLSGFIFSIRAMPDALQLVTYAVPARYFLVILRGVILKGAGLGPYHEQLGFLALYATVVLGIASVRLARRAT